MSVRGARSIAALVLAFTMMGAAGASAQELDKKQAGALGRLASQVTMAQTTLDTYGPEKRVFTARLNEDFARKLAKFEEMLAALPADNADVKKEAEHLAAFKAALATQSAAFEGATKGKEDEKAGFMATLEGPQAEADLEALKQLVEMFKSFKRYELSFYLYSRWPTHQDLALLRSWSEGWPTTQKQLADLTTKYEAAAISKGRLEGKAAMARANFNIALREAKRNYDAFKAAIETFAKDAPAQVDKDGAALKAESEQAVAAKDFNAFIQNEGKIEALRYRVTNIAAVWKPLAPSEAEGNKVEARAKAMLAEGDATMEKLAELIMKENKGPKEKYAGADRAKLEAYVRGVWAKHFPKESIAAVRFGGSEFERSVAWRYDSAARAFVKSDSSALPVWVVVKDGPKQAIMWFSTLYKLHMKGDELQLNWIDRPSRGAPPDRRLLLSNL